LRQNSRDEGRSRGDEGGSIELRLPEGCDWFIWRLLVDERMKVRSEAELEAEWSIDDVVMAHGVLDAIDAAEAEARRRADRSD
jgi:hypothetical protein